MTERRKSFKIATSTEVLKMNTSDELDQYIAKLEAEAERCTRLARELREAKKRALNGGAERPLIPPRKPQQRLDLRPAGEQKSVRTLALELIEKASGPLHVDELVKLINEQRKDPTNRAAVESQLVRALSSGKFQIKRTAPGTFGVA
jgi:hypothetical protein